MLSLILVFLINNLFEKIDKEQQYVFTYSFAYPMYESENSSNREGQALLISNLTESYFTDMHQYRRDTVWYSKSLDSDTKKQMMFSMPRPTFKYTLQKNLTLSTYKYDEIIHNTSFSFNDSLPPIIWEIKEETMDILGYSCQKAEGTMSGRIYEAWFSSEIPINDGPYKFSGLPGLIFSVTDKGKRIKFQLIGIEKNTGGFIPNKKSNLVTKKVFQERMDHYFLHRQEYANSNSSRKIMVNGREETMEEFYTGIKQDYLNRFKIELE